jgi:hypothetical protein
MARRTQSVTPLKAWIDKLVADYLNVRVVDPAVTQLATQQLRPGCAEMQRVILSAWTSRPRREQRPALARAGLVETDRCAASQPATGRVLSGTCVAN